MKSSDVILILAACIKPQLDVPVLYLKDEFTRLKHYLDALNYYIEETTISQIIFCDNSNFEYDYSDIIITAKKLNKQL